jgi:hypothetical protein
MHIRVLGIAWGDPRLRLATAEWRPGRARLPRQQKGVSADPKIEHQEASARGKSCVASRRTCRPRRLFDSARFSPSELLRARNTADSDEPRLLLPPVKSPRDDGRLPNVFVCQRLHRCLETKQSPCSLGLRCAATSMTPTDQRGDRTSAFSESVSCPRTIAFIRIRAGGCKASGRSPRTTSTEPRCPSSTP